MALRAGMLVTIRLFARLREIAGASELERTLPDGATARTAWDALVGGVPALGGLRDRRFVRGERGVRAAHGDAQGRRRGRVSSPGVRRVRLGAA